MSDAPGQVADVPLVAVVVDSPVARSWVSDSLAALAEHQSRLAVVHAQARHDREKELAAADVVVDLSRERSIRAVGEQTVLSVWHGTTAATSATALLREAVAARRTVTTTIVAENASGDRTVVVAARTALARRSRAENRRRVVSKIPVLLLRAVDSVLQPARRRAIAAPADLRVELGALVGGPVRLGAHAARSLLTSLTATANYEVAWGARGASDSPLRLPREMHWVDHPPDRFLADPFLAREAEQTFVFVEDYSRREGYATIGVFEPANAAATFRTVLDRGTHISYPFVFRDHSGEWLMLPETAAERRVTLFRASSFPDGWEEDTVLVEDVSAYDPTIVFRDGLYWLFYASGTPGSAPDDELYVAFSETLRGPYAQHPWNPVKSDVIGSRPAGRLFDWNGRLIRPAQDSSQEYGYAIVFQEVTALTRSTFAERQVDRLTPDWARGLRGMHSWDILDDIVVTDAKRLRRRTVRGLLRPSRAR